MRTNVIIEKLNAGDVVEFRPKGNSMTPRIESGQLVTIAPCVLTDCKVNDIVYCKVRGSVYLHLIKKIDQDGRLLIGNNHGHDNGWTTTVYGKLIKIKS